MSGKHIVFATILLVGCGWLLYGEAFQTEEQQIRSAYRDMLQDAMVPSDIPPLERIFVAKRLTQYFSKNVKGAIVQPSYEKQEEELSRNKLENILLHAYRSTKQISPQIISDRYEHVGEDRMLYSKLRIYAGYRESDKDFLEEFDVTLSYKLQDDAWVIKEILAERIAR